MSLNDARQFVVKMGEDNDFKGKILETVDSKSLVAVLLAEGLTFDQRELVEAMAECMAQLEQQIKI